MSISVVVNENPCATCAGDNTLTANAGTSCWAESLSFALTHSVSFSRFWRWCAELVNYYESTENDFGDDANDKKIISVLKGFCIQTNRNTCQPTKKRWDLIRQIIKTDGKKLNASTVVLLARMGIDVGSDPRNDAHDFITFMGIVDNRFNTRFSDVWKISRFDDLIPKSSMEHSGTVSIAVDHRQSHHIILYGENKRLPLTLEYESFPSRTTHKLQSVVIQYASIKFRIAHVVAFSKCEEEPGNIFLFHPAIDSDSKYAANAWDVSDIDVFGIGSRPMDTRDTHWALIKTTRCRFLAIYAIEQDFKSCK